MMWIKSASGFYREVRPHAGLIDVALMFGLAFVSGGFGLSVAAVYFVPMPVTWIVLIGFSHLLPTIFLTLVLAGGGSAVGLVGWWLLQDMLEERRRRDQALRWARSRPGPWSICVIREERFREPVVTSGELTVIPRRWR